MIERAGQTIDGRYAIRSLLGSGGMAEVYACEDLQLGRMVALKLLHAQLAMDEAVVERFRREAHAAEGLKHPNIVTVFQRGDWDGLPYMAMELVEGVTLKEVIQNQAPLDPIKAIDEICDVLAALQYAHKRGLVHRDIKPQNILVAPDGAIKVADFGIARAIDDLQITQTGAVIGSPQYISPEQASGDPITPSVDLYATGVVLFEMLTGSLPFDGDQPVAVAVKHMNEDPPSLSVVNDSIPADLERLVLHALGKTSETRFEYADEFAAALQKVRARIVAGEPVPETDEWPAALPESSTSSEAGTEDSEKTKARRTAIRVTTVLATLTAFALFAYIVFGRYETVPKVTGLTTADATQQLQNRGLKPLLDEGFDGGVPRGRISKQDPAVGVRKRHGSEVRIVVSKGPAAAAIPNVVGQLRVAARDAVRKVGFTRVDEQPQASTTVASGIVIAVSPEAGIVHPLGQRITLVVSSGPPVAQPSAQVVMPNLKGRTEAAATKIVSDLGLQPHVVPADSKSGKIGRVVKQSPKRGDSVVAGGVVQLTIPRDPRKRKSKSDSGTIDLPNVVGDSLEMARTRLKSSGLRVRVTIIDITSKEDNGKVVSQNPSEGRAVEGTTIQLVVGRLKESK